MSEDIDFTALLEAIRLSKRGWASKTDKEILKLMESARTKNTHIFFVTPNSFKKGMDWVFRKSNGSETKDA